MSYYTILEISPGASLEEITRAYRKMAMKWHPDRNNGSKYAEDKFKEVKKAYEALSSPSYKYEPPKAPPKPEPPKYQVSNVFPDVTLVISLNEVETGALVKGSKQSICGTCNGSGKLFNAVHTIGGNVWGRQEVYATEEDKKLNRCPTCKGAGEAKEFECYFDIPPGVWDGVTIKLNCLTQDKQQIYRGAFKNVRIQVEQHPFHRKGNDLHLSMAVDPMTMEYGGEVIVYGLNNKKMAVKVPAESKQGTTLRLSNVGLPDLQTRERGNIYLTLRNQ
jgi:DnaJ-class molecular chaperone